jgi:hypothetical protein
MVTAVVALPFTPTRVVPLYSEVCAEQGCRAMSVRQFVGTMGGRVVSAFRCGQHAPALVHGYDLYDPAMRPTGTVGRP